MPLIGCFGRTSFEKYPSSSPPILLLSTPHSSNLRFIIFAKNVTCSKPYTAAILWQRQPPLQPGRCRARALVCKLCHSSPSPLPPSPPSFAFARVHCRQRLSSSRRRVERNECPSALGETNGPPVRHLKTLSSQFVRNRTTDHCGKWARGLGRSSQWKCWYPHHAMRQPFSPCGPS